MTVCWLVISPMSRFANVLWHSAKKWNECWTCTCICLVLSAMTEKSVLRMYIPHYFSRWSGEHSEGTDPTRTQWLQKSENRTLAKRLVGEMTFFTDNLVTSPSLSYGRLLRSKQGLLMQQISCIVPWMKYLDLRVTLYREEILTRHITL